MNAFLESRRFGVLLVAQIFAIFVAPLLSEPRTETLWFRVAVWSVLGAGLYAAASRRAVLGLATALFLVAAWAWFGPSPLGPAVEEMVRFVSVTASLVFTACVVLVAILRHEHVTSETLLGGINVFLLLGFAFTLAHATLELSHPGAYTVHGDPLLVRVTGPYDGRGMATTLYFSFTTLTTLGFGDIVPQSDGARLLTTAEAVIGQLYIAIFIGRIVGLEVGERTAHREQRRPATIAGDARTADSNGEPDA